MLNNQLYPWLERYWQQIQSLIKQSRLPHALMLRGVDGLGLELFARIIGSSLLCKSPTNDGYSCGLCSDCKLVEAGTHPDLHTLTVADDKKLISIDQVRGLVKVCMERPHQGGYRIAIIDPCTAMNTAAANALLKTLEEPGDNTLLILVSSSTSSLPATVRSRCQLMTIDAPAEAQGIEWLTEHHSADKETITLALRLSSHAPIQAMSLLSSERLHVRQQLIAGMARAANGHLDPIKLVAKINKFDLASSIDWMYSLALDAEKIFHGVPNDKVINNDHLTLLQLLVSNRGPKLDIWIEKLIEARRLLATTSNINPQLITEDLMFRWIAIFKLSGHNPQG